MTSESTLTNNVTHCHNLISSPHGSLTVAPTLHAITNDDLTPLACHGAITLLFNNSASELAILCHPSQAVYPLAQVKSPPLCAVASPTGFIVMTSSGPLSITLPGIDNPLTDHSDMADNASISHPVGESSLPPVTIRATPLTPLSEPIQSLTISKLDFSRSEVDLTDASSLSPLRSAILDAYSNLCTRAAAQGACLQPILAAVRYLDAAGKIIHTSPPVPLLPPSASWQLTDSLTLSGTKADDSTLRLNAFSIQATPFSIDISQSSTSEQWSLAGVSSIQILISPMIHPVDFSDAMPATLIRPSTSTPALRVAVPGATARFSSLISQRISSMRELAQRFNNVAVTLATISTPCPQSLSLPTSASADPASASRLIERSLAISADSTPSFDNSLLKLCSPPASFVARSVALSGDAIVWADITPLTACTLSSLSIDEWFSSSIPDQPSELTIAATLSSGQRLITRRQLSFTPLAMAPVIPVDIPLAAELSIYVNSAGQISETSMQLSPAGDAALFIAPVLQAIPLTAASPSTTIPSPDLSTSPATIHGSILTASASSPLIPIGVMHCINAPVAAILPAPRSASALSATARRFNIFSAAGTHLLTLSSSLLPLATALIDSRAVDSPSVVTPAPHATIFATRCGALVALYPSSSRTLLSNFHPVALAFQSSCSRLITLDSAGNLDFYALPASASAKTPVTSARLLIPCGVSHLFSSGSLTLFRAPLQGLYRLEPHHPDASVPIRYSFSCPVAPNEFVTALSFLITASSFSGTITISASHSPHPDSSRPVISYSFNGALNRPCTLNLIAPFAPWFHISITGYTMPDFTIHSIHLLTHKH